MEYKPLEFKNPADFVCFFDDAIQRGEINLHPWQFDVHDYIGSKDWNAEEPCRIAIVAPNGAGKDSYIIACAVLFLAATQCDVQVVVTSSSVNQVSKQTEPRLRILAQAVNNVLGFEFFIIQKHHIFSNYTGSVIDLYVTDEAGKAEGWHPLKPGKKFMMVFNEAKSIPNNIFEAAERCNGFTHWIEISSPGKRKGHFYESTLDPNFKVWRLTYKDCPHIKASQVEYIKKRYKEGSALFKSSLMAEFIDEDSSTLVSLLTLEECYLNPPIEDLDFLPLRAGLDLAAGGDEIVISIWKGNRQIDQKCFVEKNTEASVDIIALHLKNFKVKNIYADDGGIGRGIIDRLISKGFSITRVLNQSRAINPTEFANRGTELWFNFARMIQERSIILLDESILRDQITSRCYTRSDTSGKIILESKQKAKSRGMPSPDRADAAVLAQFGLIYENFANPKKREPDEIDKLPDLPEGLGSVGMARHLRSCFATKEEKKIGCFQSNIRNN